MFDRVLNTRKYRSVLRWLFGDYLVCYRNIFMEKSNGISTHDINDKQYEAVRVGISEDYSTFSFNNHGL